MVLGLLYHFLPILSLSQKIIRVLSPVEITKAKSQQPLPSLYFPCCEESVSNQHIFTRAYLIR
eukprot:3620459-Rhodomonas_salina.1